MESVITTIFPRIYAAIIMRWGARSSCLPQQGNAFSELRRRVHSESEFDRGKGLAAMFGSELAILPKRLVPKFWGLWPAPPAWAVELVVEIITENY
jgi:hypothetical protein